MAGDFDQLNRKMNALQRQLDGRATRQITTRVATQAKKDIEKEVASDLGADRRMSNWKRALGSGFDFDGDAAVLKPRPSGPWQVVEQGAKPHTVVPKRRRGKGAALRTPFGFYRIVQIPKTRGHKTWSRSVTVIKRETPKRVHREVQTALREVFG